MERFQIQAKKFLVKGQNEDAKNELQKEMEKELIIQKYDTQICAFSKIFDMSEKVIQFLEAFNVLKACNEMLLAELEEGEGVAQSKEYQELIKIDKLITNYIDILNSFEGVKNWNYNNYIETCDIRKEYDKQHQLLNEKIKETEDKKSLSLDEKNNKINEY